MSEQTLDASTRSMVSSIVSQIQCIENIDISGSAKLNDALQASRWLTLESKQQIATAINGRCMTAAAAPAGQRRGTQSVTDLTSYFTPSDWQILQNPNMAATKKIAVCCERLMMTGIRNPSESCVRHVVAVIALSHCPDALPNALHSMVLDVKASFAAKKSIKKTSQVHLAKYPTDPRELPSELYTPAYTDEAPIKQALVGYTAMVSKVPMRATNKHLPGALPAASSTQDTSTLNVIAQLLQQLMAQSGNNDLLRNLVITPSRRPAPLLDIAPQASPLASAAAASPQHALGGSLAAASDPNVDAHQAVHDAGQVALLPPAVQGRKEDSAQVVSPLSLSQGNTEADAREEDDALDGEECTEDDLAKLVASAAGNTGKTIDGKGKGKPKAKAKAKAKGKAKAAAKSKPKAKAAAKAIAKQGAAAKKPLKLGCSKCRGSKLGCVQCRDPRFNGKRFQR